MGLPLEAPPSRSTGKFPKAARILSSADYKQLHKHSIRQFGELIFIQVREGKSLTPRLGLTVSKKFGKAHERNRFKRLVREAFRELLASLPSAMEINVSPRSKSIPLTKQALLFELQALLAKIIRP
jgi:ribonuclease P protein component